MHHIDLKHDGLGKFRRLSGADKYVLQQRARVQTETWEALWRQRTVLEQDDDETLHHLPVFEAQKAHAAKLTHKAQLAAAAWSSILLKGLEATAFKMERLYDPSIFPELRPELPVEQQVPPEPDPNDPSYTVVEKFEMGPEFVALLVPHVRRKRDNAARSKKEEAQARYDAARRSWQEASHEVARQNAKARAMFEAALDDWWARAQAYQKRLQDENRQVDRFRLNYAQGKPDAVVEYFDAALSCALYPEAFPTRWNLEFVPGKRVLVVDYELPSPEEFPALKAVKYDVMQDMFEQSHWSAPEIAQFYEDAIYQTCLRCLHGLFAADEADVLASVTLNGWVNFMDKVNGRPARACILSVQAPKSAIEQANLWTADPRTWFKTLNGVAGTRLADMTAIVPLLTLKKTDDRYMPANDMAAKGATGEPGSQERE